MLKVFLACFLVVGSTAPGRAAPALEPSESILISQRPETLRPQLMVLGSVHLANHNRDIQNPQMDNVLTAKRQAEIARAIDALAAWKPTYIAVEWLQKDQAALDRRYSDYLNGRYTLSRDEIDQIGLRLAAKLALRKVYAINWNDDPPGPAADYNVEAGAKEAGEEQRLATIADPNWARNTTQLIRTHTVTDSLIALNRPEALADLNRVYYDIALLGRADHNEGANWVGAWHARNLKIFANLVRLNAKPEDRILLIIGVGHAYLLNQFAEDSHAFRLERSAQWLATH